MTGQDVVALVAALGLALLHLYAARVRRLEMIPRSLWLSMASGVSVAYVFVHLLPELAAGQVEVHSAVGGAVGWLEHHVYLMAMVGLSAFYGLERLAVRSRQAAEARTEASRPSTGVFWLHIGAFAIYNGLVGYLLVHREASGWQGLALFAVAMGLHFVVNDYGLSDHHQDLYRRRGRWLLASAILVGLGLGWITSVSELAVAMLFAFLAGGVIMNVLKEELPEQRQSRFWAFAVGAAAYTALLLAL